MLLQKVLIALTLLTWCSCINGGVYYRVNCRKFVFHPLCRGIQAKKRSEITDNNVKPERNCPCTSSDNNNDNSNNENNPELRSITNSKLLESLFANDFDVNTIYDAYIAKSDSRRDYDANLDRLNQRRKSLRESKMDFGNSDLDEDY